jgi:hypothetical protein
MKARAWEVWVYDSRTKAPWVKYRTCDRLKDAESTVDRVQGEPLKLKIVPLYPRKDEK